MFKLLSIANPETKTWFLVIWDLGLEKRVLTVYFPFYLKFYTLVLSFYSSILILLDTLHMGMHLMGSSPPIFLYF